MPSQHVTLVTGDYTVLGLESVIAIERKALRGVLRCIGRERRTLR